MLKSILLIFRQRYVREECIHFSEASLIDLFTRTTSDLLFSVALAQMTVAEKEQVNNALTQSLRLRT